MDEFLNESPALPGSKRHRAVSHDLHEEMGFSYVERIANEYGVKNCARTPGSVREMVLLAGVVAELGVEA